MGTWSLGKKLDPVIGDAQKTLREVGEAVDVAGVCLVAIAVSLMLIAAAQLATLLGGASRG